MMPRGARVLASALGILKAGQGFVFLEPTYPRDRIAYMVEDSAVSCVITLPDYVSLLPEGTPSSFTGTQPARRKRNRKPAQSRNRSAIASTPPARRAAPRAC